MNPLAWFREKLRPLHTPPLVFWLVGGALVILALWGFNQVVQQQARHTAVVAARVANEKVNAARDAQEEAVWKASVKSCKRGNIIRAAVSANVLNIRAFELSAEQARAASARHAATPAERVINLKAAAQYRALRLSLHPISPVECDLVYPEPHPLLR